MTVVSPHSMCAPFYYCPNLTINSTNRRSPLLSLSTVVAWLFLFYVLEITAPLLAHKLRQQVELFDPGR